MAGFGFTRFQVYLLNMPMGATLAVFLIASSYLCSRFNGYRTIIGSALSLIRLVLFDSTLSSMKANKIL